MQQNTTSKNKIIERVVTLNRAWKIALANIERAQTNDEIEVCKAIAERLQQQKSNWQATLIRAYPNEVWLKIDQDNDYSETLYSVRFGAGVNLSDGSCKKDAEHLPVRMAEEILTKQELTLALQPK